MRPRTSHLALRGIGAALAMALSAQSARADEDLPPKPPVTEGVDVVEHLGRKLDEDTELVDQDGRRARLGDAFTGRRPVVLVLAYYHCPMLCGLVLGGVVTGMNQLGLRLGQDFDAITISIDPSDTPERARNKRASVISALGRRGGPEWPFLVGSEAAVSHVADEVGFRYARDPRTGEWAHPAVTMILTPDGRVSRYLYGVSIPTRDLRFALVEAGEGKTGSVVERVITTCYRYNPTARAYEPFMLGFMRIGGGLILLTVLGTVGLLRLRERRARP
jgi:protein SCO1